MPTRFSYEELKNVTKNFSNKVDEGGYGSVFHGTLPSGSEIAVKHLVGFGAVNKSFVAEVQTIGSIHHFNLVSLVGFCAQKFNRLLVNKYMANGPLDRWIFNKNYESALRWHIRKKIIIDIAKGLAYLHEGCLQKIIHLDIKPQNILLDENFNARVSDFGLSKLIGRDQSRVVTTIKGTPGYMAPEWLSSVIIEKAHVYSFGIVILEILCGRPNVDKSQQEEDMHLLKLFRRKQEEGQLLDLVDQCSDDMQSNATEFVEMMKVAASCLQNEYARRPSMFAAVKLFEDSYDVVSNLK
ncbi:G-type lectin S-receptor-like serine/threonine-protein kinase SD2-5 [Gossypium hirsutum]|uniref:G-type lectin S-receptor-like serine/threonine-protein kinase SD2-5 n=1 Tax=Gossypium hirsutum TaxID=3635 RepID=A0ABM2ZK12_GOSHI|nr:G-type lectin S-receptor-like serine/threonine-protein kinase SD2-5 [Gossypium hirsutum]